MEQKAQAKNLYTAILIIAIASMVQAIFGSTLVSFLTGPFITVLVRWIVPIIIILGYVLFLLGLGKWGVDEGSKSKLKIGTILAIVAVALAWLPIPFIGWIVKILFIIAFVMMILGYGKIQGGNMARIASLILLIAAAVSLIPLLNMVTPFVYIAAWILMLVGWGKLK